MGTVETFARELITHRRQRTIHPQPSIDTATLQASPPHKEMIAMRFQLFRLTIQHARGVTDAFIAAPDKARAKAVADAMDNRRKGASRTPIASPWMERDLAAMSNDAAPNSSS